MSQHSGYNSPSPLANKDVARLKGVGPKIAEKLAKLNVFTVEDLLFHLPFRYQDRTRITPIGSVRFGMEVVVEGTIITSNEVGGKRKSLICMVEDSSGRFNIRFFHFSRSQSNILSTGKVVRCYGEVRRGAAGLEMYHPEYQVISGTPPPLDQHLSPVYPSTEGLSQNKLRDLNQQALQQLQSLKTVSEYLPTGLCKQFELPSLVDSLLTVHHPIAATQTAVRKQQQDHARFRLSFEELMAHHLSLLKVRYAVKSQTTVSLSAQSDLQQRFLAALPFNPTGAQQRVAAEIAADLGQGKPMLRLVQGDVGSGKTLVAALAVLLAVDSNFQAVLMAPTEILSEQHFTNFRRWFEPLGIEVINITGRVKGKKREAVLASIQAGSAQVIIGTHAVFQSDVHFHKLALVIIDEQHRFGVHQRLALKDKGKSAGIIPHQLIMTATPIPRTLAMSAYVDLDTSIIDELPPGRKPIETIAISDARRADVIARVHKACKEKKQTYWVCTLIEESETLQCQAAEATAEQLTKVLSDISIGLIHGRMKAAEKESVMAEFKSGEIDLLVATTVIEVGVDVPNASLMILENPERLGLAQLHQLRGRVGRGDQNSYCVLLYGNPLSKAGKQRLEIMRTTSDGFIIAERDLEIRGPGEVLGTRQTGEMQFRIADLMRDEKLLPETKQAAELLLQSWPELVPLLINRWLGQGEKYGFV